MTHRERAGETMRWLDQLLKRHNFYLPAIERRDLVDALEQLQDEAVGDYANSVEALGHAATGPASASAIVFRDALGYPT